MVGPSVPRTVPSLWAPALAGGGVVGIASSDARPWLQLDLGAVHEVQGLRVLWGGDHATTWSVSLSLDGSSWGQAATTLASGQEEEEEGTMASKVEVLSSTYIRVDAGGDTRSAPGVDRVDLRTFSVPPAADKTVAADPTTATARGQLARYLLVQVYDGFCCAGRRTLSGSIRELELFAVPQEVASV
jgi:hypothetical protein